MRPHFVDSSNEYLFSRDLQSWVAGGQLDFDCTDIQQRGHRIASRDGRLANGMV